MQRFVIGPYVWMLIGCTSFTLMYTLVHELRDACDWQVIALVRTGLACFFAVILTRLAGARLIFLGTPSLWIRSIAGSISLLCSFYAMTRNVPITNVLAINNIFPLWVAVLAWPVLGMKPGWPLMTAVVAAVAGVFLIRAKSIAEIGALLYLADDAAVAAQYSLVASVTTAIAMLGLNRLHWIDTRAVVAHFSGVAMVFSIGAMFLLERHRPLLDSVSDLQTLTILLGMGLTATAGQICLTKAFTIGAPAKVALVNLAQIVMTLVVDLCLFAEEFSLLNLLGIALVILPTAWMVSRERRVDAKCDKEP